MLPSPVDIRGLLAQGSLPVVASEPGAHGPPPWPPGRVALPLTLAGTPGDPNLEVALSIWRLAAEPSREAATRLWLPAPHGFLAETDERRRCGSLERLSMRLLDFAAVAPGELPDWRLAWDIAPRPAGAHRARRPLALSGRVIAEILARGAAALLLPEHQRQLFGTQGPASGRPCLRPVRRDESSRLAGASERQDALDGLDAALMGPVVSRHEAQIGEVSLIASGSPASVDWWLACGDEDGCVRLATSSATSAGPMPQSTLLSRESLGIGALSLVGHRSENGVQGWRLAAGGLGYLRCMSSEDEQGPVGSDRRGPGVGAALFRGACWVSSLAWVPGEEGGIFIGQSHGSVGRLTAAAFRDLAARPDGRRGSLPDACDAHSSMSTCMAFVPRQGAAQGDGCWLVSGSNDGSVRLLSTGASTPGGFRQVGFGKHRGSWRERGVNCVAARPSVDDPEQVMVLTGHSDGTLRLWNFPRGACDLDPEGRTVARHESRVTGLTTFLTVTQGEETWWAVSASRGELWVTRVSPSHVEPTLVWRLAGEGPVTLAMSGAHLVVATVAACVARVIAFELGDFGELGDTP